MHINTNLSMFYEGFILLLSLSLSLNCFGMNYGNIKRKQNRSKAAATAAVKAKQQTIRNSYISLSFFFVVVAIRFSLSHEKKNLSESSNRDKYILFKLEFFCSSSNRSSRFCFASGVFYKMFQLI